jgi:hypothetical protein
MMSKRTLALVMVIAVLIAAVVVVLTTKTYSAGAITIAAFLVGILVEREMGRG